jgi:hypothetical protein
MPRKELLLSTRLAISALVVVTLAITAATISNDSYIVRDGDITWMFGQGMSAAALGKIQSQFGHEFVWARRSGHTYVIRDHAVINDARAAIAPRLTRVEQQQRVARIVDSAIQNGKAQVVN